MQFRGYHGCLESEQRDGNWFRVDLAYDYDMRKAILTDDLAYAVDYGAIYAVIQEEMARPAKLLEHLAGRILNVLTDRFPMISYAELTVTKFNPPLDGRVESSSVTVTYE
ncbi:MAG: dihydroneopterin aldolase [Bacteroidales bacterium]|nr:dihydroneopterin aldolase [Bacteroidales bacterium]